jgi:predicted transcriptional regulator of viral defense system
MFGLVNRTDLWHNMSVVHDKYRHFGKAQTLMASETEERVLGIAKSAGLIRPRDLDRYGIARKYLNILFHKGFLDRMDRGVYTCRDADVSANVGLAQAAKRVPHGVICLLSALQFHEIGTQNPHEVWMAIDPKARRARVGYPPLRIVRFSGEALTEGIRQHRIEGVLVKICNPAKTVADCFKYRNKIGLDVAIEALRDCLQNRKCTRAQLWQCAKICRVTEVMRPYLEAIS